MPAVAQNPLSTGGANVYFRPPSSPNVPGTQQYSSGGSGGGSAPDVIPGAAIYGQIEAAAQEAYDKALANINGQRNTTLRQYGYLGDINPNTGELTNMHVDPNNPYGLYQEMLYNHGTAQEKAREDADNRGLGHIGLGAQGVAADQRSFGADSSQLGQNLMQQLEGLQSQQDTAQQTEQDALWQAELAQAQAQIQAQNFHTGDFTKIDQPSGNDNTPPPSTNQLLAIAKKVAPAKPQTKAAVKARTNTVYHGKRVSGGRI